MSREILVTATPFGCRAAVLGERGVRAFLIESSVRPSRVGDLHVGQVTRVVPQLSGAFVALGEGVEGWLETARRLTPGERLVVQVLSDARGGKGPRLSAAPSLAGRHLVYRPEARTPTVSQHITDAAARARLERWLGARVPANGAFVARRRAAESDESLLHREAALLTGAWQAVERDAERRDEPRRLRSAGGLIGRLLRDHLAPGGQLIIDDRAAYDIARARAAGEMPELANGIVLADTEPDLFERHDCAGALAAALEPVQPFAGGRLVIESTEALTAIDVDIETGPLIDAARAAIDAAAAAIIQRNLGGLIVLDPPRLKGRAKQTAMVAQLGAALADDRVEHRVYGLTTAGLLELTRQRVGESVSEALTENDATGARLPRLDALAFDLAVAARRAVRRGSRRLTIRASPRLIAALEQGGANVAAWLGAMVRFQADPTMPQGRFEVGTT